MTDGPGSDGGAREGAPRTAFHFIAGLPRAGSTLLSALLRQNPRFHAGITSPLFAMVTHLVEAMSGEGAMLVGDARREAVLRGLFRNYYGAEAGGRTVFDTNRLWTSRLPLLLRLFPGAKVICPVRDMEWVMDSLERAVAANPLLASRLYESAAERASVVARVEALSARDRLLGASWEALRTGCYGPHGAALLLVPYDHLVRRPHEVLGLVYAFLGEPPFRHDTENVAFEEPAFDDALRTPGLHRVAPAVRAEERALGLPPDLARRLAALNFWHEPGGMRANVVGRAT